MSVPMKHLDLVCVAADRSAMLERLRGLGAVQLDLASADGAAVAAARGEIEEAGRAVRLIMKARGRGFSEDIRPASVTAVLALDADRAELEAERERLERQRGDLSSETLAACDRANTYHDGKWVMFAPTDARSLPDLETLLALKRRPNRKPGPAEPD